MRKQGVPDVGTEIRSKLYERRANDVLKKSGYLEAPLRGGPRRPPETVSSPLHGDGLDDHGAGQAIRVGQSTTGK